MSLALFFIIYGVIGCLAARPVAGHIAWTFVKQHNHSYRHQLEIPTGEQWFGASLCAMVLCAVWPIILIAVVAGGMMPKIGNEKAAEVANQKKYIKQLERELDLN